MEGLAKQWGASCLITDKAYRGIRNPGEFSTRILGTTRAKGKEKPVTIYELFDGDPSAIRDQKLASKSRFTKAVGLAQIGELERAKAIFQVCLVSSPKDTSAKR